MNLVIIEGVGKVEAIKKYLGKDYDVFATKGHIRDLPTKTLGVDIKNDFEPEYVINADKKQLVADLKKKASQADKIYLASDPDREGEAISWHVAHVLGLDPNDKIRVTYNAIEKKEVLEGIANPRAIDLNLVNAQQCRRILDRLVGYKLSPIICKKIQPKLSAGRVQSVTLKLVVDREKEINEFKPQEFWTLNANLYTNTEKDLFKSALTKVSGKKADIKNKESMNIVLSDLGKDKYLVKNVKKSIGKTHATPPYTTSALQQDANSKLGMSLKRCTQCAQELYEGVNLGGEGKVPLVTYIRTDSVRVAPEAMAMAKAYILENYGDKYYPLGGNHYQTKASAQDAHEAIRPIYLNRTPESVKEHLSPDNYKLYRLIYNKFLSSQMADATYNSVIAEIENGKYTFKASGKTPIFDGFTILYNKVDTKKKDENAEEENEDNLTLPIMEVGQELQLKSLVPNQKYTKPPARFTEATLVHEMEVKGIGRPSTYSATVTILLSRLYTLKEGKYLKPTELGIAVTDLLDKYFSDVINVKFTANMESELDEIADKGIDWHDIITKFYGEFVKLLETADKDSVRMRIEPKPTNEVCDKCGSPMVIRTGRYGEFMACSNFPACKNIKTMAKVVGKCPKCGKDVLEKKSKKGKIFYGCSGYPNCDFVSWDKPVEEKCPKCSEYMVEHTSYGKTKIKCSKCDYSREIVKENKTETSESND